MHGADIAFGNGGHRHVSAAECLFDTKTFAMNRHEIFPDLHSSSSRRMRFNIGFTPGTDIKRALAPIDKRLTMPSRASLKINAADKTRRVRNVVNRKPVSVYQTDAVLVFSVLRALEQALATAKQ